MAIGETGREALVAEARTHKHRALCADTLHSSLFAQMGRKW